MISRQELEGKWNSVVGQVRERWGELTNDELEQAHGNAEQLVGIIQQKTGAARREIEEFLDHSIEAGQSMLERGREAMSEAQEKAGEYAARAGEAAHQAYDQVAETAQQGVRQATQVVRRHPLESLATAFGVGLLIGIVVSATRRA